MNSFLTRFLLLSLGILIGLPDCFSQPAPKPEKYTTIITSTVRTKKKGTLMEAGDSSILIYLRKLQMSIPASTIKQIKIKRSKAAGRGALTGGLIGLTVGAIAGYASGDEDPCQPGTWFCDQVTAEEKALGLGLAMSAGGALVGTIVGSYSKVEKIVINGDQPTFLNNVDKIRKYITSSFEKP